MPIDIFSDLKKSNIGKKTKIYVHSLQRSKINITARRNITT